LSDQRLLRVWNVDFIFPLYHFSFSTTTYCMEIQSRSEAKQRATRQKYD
jgi:hypothetical protein